MSRFDLNSADSEGARKLVIKSLEERSISLDEMAAFGAHATPDAQRKPVKNGFSVPRSMAVFCTGWIWHQWLRGAEPAAIRSKVEAFIERGMEMQKQSPLLYMRPRHDLILSA